MNQKNNESIDVPGIFTQFFYFNLEKVLKLFDIRREERIKTLTLVLGIDDNKDIPPFEFSQLLLKKLVKVIAKSQDEQEIEELIRLFVSITQLAFIDFIVDNLKQDSLKNLLDFLKKNPEVAEKEQIDIKKLESIIAKTDK